MPSGYTYKVQNGEIVDLKDFAMDCARAFGACITMRDDPASATIPEYFVPDIARYEGIIESSKEAIESVDRMTVQECEEKALEEFNEAKKSNANRKGEKSLQELRYENMIEQVIKWSVPVELAELKSFMLRQLRESISMDCGGSYAPPEPVLKSAKQWRSEQINQALKEIEYYTKLRDEEIERVKGRNEWLKMLRESLK